MNKLVKLGLTSFSIFVLNSYTQFIVKPDENISTETIAIQKIRVMVIIASRN